MSYENINNILSKLINSQSREENTVMGITLANEVMMHLGVPQKELLYGEDALNNAFENSKFRNQKMETWFEKHPFFDTARIALYHYKGSLPVESNFYQLNEAATKAKISAITQLTPNWEDSKLTMHPNYSVGIDFFLNYEGNSLKIVITNQGNLRVLEISEHLSNTQIEILENIKGCFLFNGIDVETGVRVPFEPQRTIHRTLWNAFELQQVNKKFYDGVADHFSELYQHLKSNPPKDANVDFIDNETKLFSSRLLGRLLFLWFLKKKSIINHEMDYFGVGDLTSTEYYQNKLKTLFFNVLNTPVESREYDDVLTPYLNGGLFEPHINDWVDCEISFPVNWFGSLFKHFNKFNFTTDESTLDYEQVAIDPEMLGRVFENLLASIRPETEASANERSKKGAFYTPREIVTYINKESLKEYLKTYVDNENDHKGIDSLIEMNDARYLENKSSGISKLWGERSDEVKIKLLEALDNLKILDPAVGSGAFPIGMLQLLVKTYERLSGTYDAKFKKHRLLKSSELSDSYLTKLSILRNNLYGVDIEPMAIEIAKLRSWLSLIVDDKGEIEPLPNLDFNFVCANSLIMLDKPIQVNLFENLSYEEEIVRLREEYFQTHDKDAKKLLKAKFSELYHSKLEDDAKTKRVQQLRSWNPFEADKPAEYYDSKLMFNVDGFDLVIGNPPYIHFEDIKEESKNIYKPLKYKTYEARGDIYTLFYEMGINVLKDGGHLCFITSNKWMRTGYGEKLRNYLVNNTFPKLLIDLGSGVFESATVDTNIVLIQNNEYCGNTVALTLGNGENTTSIQEKVGKQSIEIKFYIDQPWIILSPIEQSIRNKVEKNGLPLRKWPELKINFGIKTGLNKTFIIDNEKRKEILANCMTETERIKTETIIQPILRGRDIKRNTYEYANLYVILAEFGSHKWMQSECPSLYKYLLKSKTELEKRGQCRYLSNGEVNNSNDSKYPGYPGMHHWLELDNNPRRAYFEELSKPKIIYSEIVRSPQFHLDKSGFLVDASAFFITGDNLEYLVQILNSELVAYIFKKFYAGGGLGDTGYRYKKVFLENLPIPYQVNQIIDVNNETIAKMYELDSYEIGYIYNHLGVEK